MKFKTTAFVVLMLLLSGKIGAADGPGLGNLQYDPAEVFGPVSIITSPNGHGNAAIINGYLMVIYSPDGGGRSGGGGIEFWDVSNPRQPQLHRRWDNPDTQGLREAHGFGFTQQNGRDLMVAQAIEGIQFWDVTDPDAVFLVSYLDLPGITSADYGGAWWTFWQAPIVYVAGVDEGLYVVDASNPAAPEIVRHMPTSELGGLNPGIVQAIGNLLFVGRHQGNGYAMLDVSEPRNPSLLSTIAGISGYSHMFAAGKILTSGGDGGLRTMHVHNVTAGGSITYASSGPVRCSAPSQLRLGNGGYGSYQDGYFLSGFSNTIAKFDISTNELIGCGSSSIIDRDEDFAQALGNLVWAGNDHGQGSALIPHQTAPDTIGPDVHWVNPPDTAVGVRVSGRIGVSMSDTVELDSVTSDTFSVREIGGAVLAGRYSFQMAIINFSPDEPLKPDTTYEILIDGLQDVSGNIGSAFRSEFTTEDIEVAGCVLSPLSPAEVETTVSLSAASVSGAPPFSYSWNFGDGVILNTAGPAENHIYGSAGRFNVVLTVTDPNGRSACSGVQIVHNPLTPLAPTASTSIVHDGLRSYNVNPDNDTVTAIDGSSLAKIWEANVGAHPQTIAIAPDGNLWVTVDEEAAIYMLDWNSGAIIGRIDLDRGSAPYGVVFSPDKQSAYVTLQASGRLLKLAPDGQILATAEIGPTPRGIAVTADSARILVTRFISPSISFGNAADPGSIILPAGEVRELAAGSLQLNGTRRLRFDTGMDTENSGRGVPNYLSAVRVSADGLSALLPSKKDNVARGDYLDGQPVTFESRVRSIVSELNLTTNTENVSRRIDFNDRSMAQSVIFSPLGDIFFVGFQGSNLIDVYDTATHEILGSNPVSRAPHGMVIDAATNRLFVHNLMSRSVSVFDVSALLGGTGNAATLLAETSTVGTEALTPDELRGKQIFYDASDPRVSRDGYLSCAGCHLDGRSDGQIWDMTQVGEGLRNTISLVGKAGLGHGNLHWTGNFDEVQDFENDIREISGGSGFLSDADYAATRDPLGPAKAGLSSDLDALAAYLNSLDRFSDSPFRDPDRSLTSTGEAGHCVFNEKGCADCHAGTIFTDGLRHDVGTIQPSSGNGLGTALAGVGIDTPTLRGVWNTAPYLHNGQARTLTDVLSQAAHVGQLSNAEKANLTAYVLQLDASSDPEPRCGSGNPVSDDGGDQTPERTGGGGAIGAASLAFLLVLWFGRRRAHSQILGASPDA